jgi:hypothetical protein
VDQLQEDNKVSELLKDLNISEEKCMEVRKKIKALRNRCNCASNFSNRELDDAKLSQHTVSLMEKGTYIEEAREVCRVLVSAGCSQEEVGKVIEAIFDAVGVVFEGPRISSRTVT